MTGRQLLYFRKIQCGDGDSMIHEEVKQKGMCAHTLTVGGSSAWLRTISCTEPFSGRETHFSSSLDQFAAVK